VEYDQTLHIERLLDVLQRRLQKLELHSAQMGILTQPHVLIDIEDIKAYIVELEQLQGRSTANKSSETLYCPYPGTPSYDKENTKYFYGRRDDTLDVLERLHQNRLVCLIGSSGAGKTSLLKAGVIPLLEQRQSVDGKPLLVCEIRPGNEPIEKLEKALGGSIRHIRDTVTKVLMHHQPVQQILLVIDQFEELFTLTSDSERREFFASLVELYGISVCRILLIMRSDFYSELLDSDLWPLVKDYIYSLPILHGTQLREVIEAPANALGVTIDSDLLIQLLTDAQRAGTAVLPLLQEVMIALWWRMTPDRRLTLNEYKRIGEFITPFIARANEALDCLDEIQFRLARRILLRLLQFHLDRPPTRRQVDISDLRAAYDDSKLLIHTIGHLVSRRLLTVDMRGYIDLAHESLIASWPRLRAWIEEYQQFEQVRRWVDDKVYEWIQLGQDEGGLLDAIELERADAWLASPRIIDLGYHMLLPNLVQQSRSTLERIRANAERVQELTNILDIQNTVVSENMLTLIRDLEEGVMMLDGQQRVRLMNSAAGFLLQLSGKSVNGQSLREMNTAADDRAKRAAKLYDALSQGLQVVHANGHPHLITVKLTKPDQVIAIRIVPIAGTNELKDVIVLRDVTLELAADHAMHEFIQHVSHELRTPLTSIKGYIDLLLLGAAGPVGEGQLSFLNVVKNNANRLMELINDILEIGRIDADKITLNFEQVNIEGIFNDALQTLRAEIDRKEIDVTIDIDADLPQIEADSRRLTQIILNLVSNAVKYTYPGGKVNLRATLNPSGMAEVNVSDNGVGIPLEQQELLFRLFYRVDNLLNREVGGIGLGLTITKSLLELHGGHIWVQSQLDKGSIFSFVLPIIQPIRDNLEDDTSIKAIV
jgi:signal transduction histidine kinase/energy-coupling factor transporter ATP-binding protein EcfA2